MSKPIRHPIQKILICDHVLNDAKMLKDIFISMKYSSERTYISSNPKEALKTAKTDKDINLIICYYNNDIPEWTTFIHVLRSIQRYRCTNVLIIAETENFKGKTMLQIDYNIENFITKPLHPDTTVKFMSEFIKQIEMVPKIKLHFNQIEEALLSGDIKTASESLKNAKDIDKNDKWVHFYAGEIAFFNKEYEQAEIHYLDAMAIDNEFLIARGALGRTYVAEGNLDLALKMLTKIQDYNPKNIIRTIEIGKVHLEKVELEKAEEAFTSVLDMEAENEEAKMGMGKTYFQQGKIAEARDMLKGLDDKGVLATYFNNLAIKKIEEGKFNEGIKCYQSAIAVMPTDEKKHVILYNIGLAYKRANHIKEAHACFLKVLELVPDYQKAIDQIAAIEKMQKMGS